MTVPSTRLSLAIYTHRQLFKEELALNRLASSQPPTTMDVNTGQLYSEPAARVGMTVAGSLLRRLGHPEGYGQSFPWARALWLLRVECRRNHPHHRSGDRPYWRGSLCQQAVRLIVIGGEAFGTGPLSPEQAGKILRVDKMEPLLLRAFRIIEDAIDAQQARAEARAREDSGYGAPVGVVTVHEHRPLDGLHAIECPQCRRNAA